MSSLEDEHEKTKSFFLNMNGMDPKIAGPLCWFVYHQLSLCAPNQLQTFVEMTNELSLVYYCGKCRGHFEQGLGRTPMEKIIAEPQIEKDVVRASCYLHNMVNKNLNKYVFSSDELETFRKDILHQYTIEQQKEQKSESLTDFEKSFVWFLFLLSANFPVYYSSSLPRHRLLKEIFPSFFQKLIHLIPRSYRIAKKARETNAAEIRELLEQLKQVDDSILVEKGRMFYMVWTMALVFYICPRFIQEELHFKGSTNLSDFQKICGANFSAQHWQILISSIETTYRFRA